MKTSSLITGTLLTSLLFSSVTYADGLTLSATRLIYDATKKEASVNLTNSGKNVPQLVQSWVSDVEGNKDNIPFVITPPLSKLDQNSTIPVRVVQVTQGGRSLPSDRESLFLLNVRAIPATEKVDNPQRMTIAIQNTIKLMYRPAGLSSKDAGTAGEKLTLSAVATGVKLDNPTPYVVNLTAMTINGQAIERPGEVLPFSSLTVPFTAGKARDVSFSTINDFGGITTARTVKI